MGTELYIYLGLMVFFLVTAGFFSGSETAFTHLDPLILHNITGKRMAGRARRILQFTRKPENLIVTFLIGTNISIVSATVLFSTLFRKLSLRTTWQWTVLFSAIVLIFSEILPKILYRKRAMRASLQLVDSWSFFTTVFTPFTFLLSRSVDAFLSLFGVRRKQGLSLTRDELERFIQESTSDELIDEKEMEIISEVFDFGSTTAREVMTPLNDIIAIEKHNRVSNIMTLFRETNLSKIPVYDSRVYRMIGYININDLFHAKLNNRLDPFIKPPYYVPESKKVDELFFEMTKKKEKICFVVEEFGGVSGIITLRDIAEEIVGDISDPGEPRVELVRKITRNEYQVEGYADLDDLNDRFNLDLPKRGYETLAGFLMSRMGRIPKKGETHAFQNILFTVLKADKTTVHRVGMKLHAKPKGK